MAIAILFLAACNSGVQYPYLDDAPTATFPEGIAGHKGYPKINHSETKAQLDIESLRKYSEVSSISANELPYYVEVKKKNPEVLIIRKFHPIHLIAHSSGDFLNTGPVTYWPTLYAGHWAYEAGKILEQDITSNQNTVYLGNISGLQLNYYVVIYDAPAGSFNNAEHARIMAIDSVQNKVTLSRGYKSDTYNHRAGAIVAQHGLREGGPAGWMYNFSTLCPKDGAGKILAEVRADWIADNYYKTLDGVPVDPDLVDGIMLDAEDPTWQHADLNNDLSDDKGIIDGVDIWEKGMEIFYSRVREKLPDKLFIGGIPHSWAFPWLNGTQMEVWPIGFRDGRTREEAWASQFSKMNTYLHYSRGPVYSEGLDRGPTAVYPFTNRNWINRFTVENKNFRFAFALALMAGSYYGKENDPKYPDVWYDEYCVNVKVPETDTLFGSAIANTPENQAHIRENRGWMGEPAGEYRRIYDPSLFKASGSLVKNGSFDRNTDGWTGEYLEQLTDAFEGSGALISTLSSGPRASYSSAEVLDSGDYTICFAARSPKMSRLRVELNGVRRDLILTPDWGRKVFSVRVPQEGALNLDFHQYEYGDTMCLDCVYLFRGNADVIQREFQHAMIILNGTSENRTVKLDSDHKYKRILGTQDPINDGAVLTEVTIEPYDAAILVKYGK